MRRSTVALAASAVLILGACSHATGAHGKTPSPSPSISSSVPGTSTPRTTTGSGATTTTSGGGTVSPAGTSRPVVTVKATLDKACVHRGDRNDLQGITIMARPGGAAGFNTSYSDGSSSVDGKSNYQTGMGGGFADSNGQYRTTWVVPANAPPGEATVHVVAVEDSSSGPAQGNVDLHFMVQLPGMHC